MTGHWTEARRTELKSVPLSVAEPGAFQALTRIARAHTQHAQFTHTKKGQLGGWTSEGKVIYTTKWLFPAHILILLNETQLAPVRTL